MTKRNNKKDLPLEKVRELFRYENGKLYWKSTRFIGKRVGNTRNFSPIVEHMGKTYKLNRIVYLLHHGFCPEKIDFIDKTLTAERMYDISIENLYVPPKKLKTKKLKRKFKEDLSYIEVNTYLEYKNGRLYWKAKPSPKSTMEVGSLAGSVADAPSLKVQLHGKTYLQHRIVYLLHHRYFPEVVTFIDKTLTDEGLYDISIGNLKASTLSRVKSLSNVKPEGKTSKYRGVSLNKEANKYSVFIRVNRVLKFGGHFENEEEAARKYDEMARQFIGEDAVLNFPEVKQSLASSTLIEPSAF